MFIAHLPASYIVTRGVLSLTTRKSQPNTGATNSGTTRNDRPAYVVGLCAGVAPDLDLLWFYFVDGRQTHHHHFFPHLPAVWLAAGVVVIALTTLLDARRARSLAVIALANGLTHLLLDTFVGHILWAWPFSKKMFAVVEVPAVHSHWILNFVFHWTFALEIVVVIGAMLLLWLLPRAKRGTRG